METAKRVDKTNYYLDIAQTVAARGTCLRRNFGAIIVKNDEIISTGYVGAPRGRQNCCDLGYCTREKLNVPRGERYELCRSVHAEADAVFSAAGLSSGQEIGRVQFDTMTFYEGTIVFDPGETTATSFR